MDNRTEIKFFLQKMRVGFITNSHCDDLLNMSINLYKDIAPEIINIDGSKGLYGYNVFNNILSDERLQKQFDYLIYIDEDCFISNIYELYETIKFLINNDYWFAGMPDGGVISHRFHNPVSINTFFTFFNLKKIKEIYKINCASNVVFEESLKKFAPLELFKSYIPYPNEKRIKIVLQEGYKPYGINYDKNTLRFFE